MLGGRVDVDAVLHDPYLKGEVLAGLILPAAPFIARRSQCFVAFTRRPQKDDPRCFGCRLVSPLGRPFRTPQWRFYSRCFKEAAKFAQGERYRQLQAIHSALAEASIGMCLRCSLLQLNGGSAARKGHPLPAHINSVNSSSSLEWSTGFTR
jgi:hypothetical protein